MLLGERYKLELHWKNIMYERPGICELKGAYFSGPALSSAAKINPNEFINLDFVRQYYILAKRVYVAKFSWGDVIYNKNGTVSMENAALSHDAVLNIVPKLKKKDYIIIDTVGHEVEEHAYNLVYIAYLIGEDGNPYNFGNRR